MNEDNNSQSQKHTILNAEILKVVPKFCTNVDVAMSQDGRVGVLTLSFAEMINDTVNVSLIERVVMEAGLIENLKKTLIDITKNGDKNA
jgi:hypothetical protein